MTEQPANTASVIALQPKREERAQVAADDGVTAGAGSGPDPVATAHVLMTLLARVGTGDRGAFRAVFEVTRGRVFGICMRMLRNRAEAEEVLQDVFVRIWQHAAEFRGDSAKPMAWVQTITRNRCLEILRRRGVDDAEWSDDMAEKLADDSPTPEQQALQGATKHSIDECLRGLEPPQRQAIELAFYDGLSYTETAHRLARPEGTVKSQIRRGLVRLKHCLQGS